MKNSGFSKVLLGAFLGFVVALFVSEAAFYYNYNKVSAWFTEHPPTQGMPNTWDMTVCEAIRMPYTSLKELMETK